MRAWLALTRAMVKQLLKDRASLFFYFLFPLMFLVLFGLLFGNPNIAKVDVAVTGAGPLVDALPREVLNVEHFDNFESAIAEVESGDVPAAIRVDGNNVEVRYSQADQVSSATVRGVVQSVVNQANLTVANVEPKFTVHAEQVEKSSYEPIQYLTSGLLSWGIAMSAAFGAALNLVMWRKTFVLRRMRLAPINPLAIVAARIGVGLGIALLQTVVFIGVAMTPPFKLQLSGSWWLMIPLLVAGTLSFMSIGLLVGSLVKTEEAASGAVNLVILPMAFLSGAFFPISTMPEWLQQLSWIFPMRILNSSLLDVFVRNVGIGAVLVPTAALLGFTVFFTGIASRFFSWDD